MDRFIRAYDAVRVHEGGYANNPDDPGGETNRGVTQRVYNSYRKRMGLPAQTVKLITESEARNIYRNGYWDQIRADHLPDGVAYCVFDASINSGAGQAAKWLQRCVGADVDGIVGDETISMAMDRDAVDLINQYCDMRLAFMRSLSHWPAFKKTWTSRVGEVRSQAIEWAQQGRASPSIIVAQGKAAGSVSKKTSVIDTLKNPAAMSGVIGVLGSVGSIASGNGPVQYAISAVLVMGAVAAIVWLVRKSKK